MERNRATIEAMRLLTFDEVLGALPGLDPATRCGPWPIAQALEHCAQSIELSLTCYPRLRAWPVRHLVGPLVKRRFLARGFMKHDLGAQLPEAPALDPHAALPSAVARLRQAIAAFRAHPGALAPHLAYGACTKAEYEALHAMHLADHLSGAES